MPATLKAPIIKPAPINKNIPVAPIVLTPYLLNLNISWAFFRKALNACPC